MFYDETGKYTPKIAVRKILERGGEEPVTETQGAGAKKGGNKPPEKPPVVVAASDMEPEETAGKEPKD